MGRARLRVRKRSSDLREREHRVPTVDSRETMRSSNLLALQRFAGNSSVESLLSIQRAAAVDEATAQTGDPKRRAEERAARLERQRSEEAEHILRDFRDRGGLTVVFYGGHVHGPGAAAEFKRQAEQYAQDHQALGLSGGGLGFGVAMDITSEIPDILEQLEKQVDIVLRESLRIPVQTLAIFTHGIEKKLEAGPPKPGQSEQVQWIGDVKGWIGRIAPYVSPSPLVLLYACRTAGKPATGVPFAEAAEEYLQADLAASYQGPALQFAPKVWGHKTAAHTVANPNLVEFSGGIPAVQDDFATRLGTAMADRALQLSGRLDDSSGLPPITAEQRASLISDASRAVLKVFRVPGAEQTTTNKKVVYFREIPMMGMERMISDLLSDATPDFSYLGMTPKATARVAGGFEYFKGQVDKQMPWLIGLAKSSGMGDFPKPRIGTA